MPDSSTRPARDAARLLRANARAAPRENAFLAALPPESSQRVLSSIEQCTMHVHEVLWEPNSLIEWVYFPRSFVGSILVPLDAETHWVEAATVGREGFLGTPIVLGVESTTTRAIVQVAGETGRIAASTLRTLIDADPALLAHCLRYAHTLQVQTAQSVACNKRHSLDARCARWLLMTHDRVGRDEFGLLHSFLAAMLGVHRPRVTVAAGVLQQAGIISYQRGIIRIVDRAGLEAAACECYRVVRAAQDRALAPDASSVWGS